MQLDTCAQCSYSQHAFGRQQLPDDPRSSTPESILILYLATLTQSFGTCIHCNPNPMARHLHARMQHFVPCLRHLQHSYEPPAA